MLGQMQTPTKYHFLLYFLRSYIITPRCCLVFECVVFVPWKPNKYLSTSTSGYPSHELLRISLILALVQGISSVTVQMYYIICLSRNEVSIWNFVYEAQDGHFVIFSVLVSLATLLWSAPKKLLTLKKQKALAR